MSTESRSSSIMPDRRDSDREETMTLKQLWLATITLLLTVAVSQPSALVNLLQSSGESLVWVALNLLEHLADSALNH